jgi:hypothetical protein
MNQVKFVCSRAQCVCGNCKCVECGKKVTKGTGSLCDWNVTIHSKCVDKWLVEQVRKGNYGWPYVKVVE